MTIPVGYFTPKLGLQVHGMDDALDSQKHDWERLDSTFAGAIWVTPGTVPGENLLFDGAIIAEINTGKVWRAQKNANGTYDKIWIKYPWVYSARFQGNFPHGGFTWGWTDIEPTQCVNAGSDNKEISDGSNALILPVTGYYVGMIQVRFQDTNTLGQRSLILNINGTNDNNNSQTNRFAMTAPYPGNTTIFYKIVGKFNKGDKLLSYIINDSGGGRDIFSRISIALVRATGPA